VSAIARADWKPPTDFDPDLEKIAIEGKTASAAGKYQDAYQIGVWLSLHANSYNPGQTAFAWTNYTRSWPSLEQLKAGRDEAFQNLQKGESRGPMFIEFSTFSGVNKILGEENRTKEFIVWLDSNKPEVLKADHMISLLIPTLVKFKEYNLCGKYLDSSDVYWQSQILKGYQESLRAAAAHDGIDKRPNLQAYAEKLFRNRTETLIALLIIDSRKAEAQKIADEAGKILDDATFKVQIEKSLNGEMPEPWP
jgi:hypothetical protein